MCGRYAMALDANAIQGALQDDFQLPVTEIRNQDNYNPTYNVAPTHTVPVYHTSKDQSVLEFMSWGLIPFWTKKKADANQYKTFNARKESVISGQRLWTPVRKHGRCVVPVQGYYEWLHKKTGSNKTAVDKIPYYVKRKDNSIMFLAGMYDYVEFEDTKEKIGTFTIITGAAPKQTKWLHERMPIVLNPGTKEWEDWLAEKEWTDDLGNSLKEYGNDDLEWYEVSKDVGKVGNNGEYLIKPVKRGTIGDFFGKNKKEQERGVVGDKGEIKGEDPAELKKEDVEDGQKVKEEDVKEGKEEKKDVMSEEEDKDEKDDKGEVKEEEEEEEEEEDEEAKDLYNKEIEEPTEQDLEEESEIPAKRSAPAEESVSERVRREKKTKH